MRRLGGWILGVMALCSLACTIYGAFSLVRVQRQLKAGATEVRLLLDTPQQREGPEAAGEEAAPEEPAITGGAEGLLCYEGYEVAVFRGVSNSVLTKGAGRVVTGPALNAPGNCVLYGHRDSAFRFLAKVQIGDELTICTAEGPVPYQVAEILIFSPEDPEIFAPTEHATLSLVTCYPFTFVGPALQRCVVRAVPL